MRPWQRRSSTTVQPCLCLSLPLCLSASLHLCLSLCLSASLSLCAAVSLSLCLAGSLSTGRSCRIMPCSCVHTAGQSVSLSLCLSASLSASLCLSARLRVCSGQANDELRRHRPSGAVRLFTAAPFRTAPSQLDNYKPQEVWESARRMNRIRTASQNGTTF